jgi:predicted AAA+ superfamily ATPase
MDFFQNLIPSRCIKMLLVGGIGSGKSSFISTCLTALADTCAYIPMARVVPLNCPHGTSKVGGKF